MRDFIWFEDLIILRWINWCKWGGKINVSDKF